MDLLRVNEVADLIRVSASTLRGWRMSRTGPDSFRLGGRVVYRRDEVERWIQAQEAASHNTPAA